jgi:hypothetical protein
MITGGRGRGEPKMWGKTLKERRQPKRRREENCANSSFN